MHARTLLPLLFAASPATLHAGHVLRVGPTRAFTTIQPAVDAASDGDVVLVDPLAGSSAYPGFAIDGKALSIVADSGTARVSGQVDVDHLSIGQICLLANVEAAASSAAGFAVQIRHSAGAVRIQDGTFFGKDRTSYALAPAGTGGSVSFCDDLVLTRCTVRGGHGATQQDATIAGGLGLFARSSDVGFFGCSFTGGHGSSDGSGDAWDGGRGGNALETPEGRILASGCTFTGGFGGVGGEGTDPFDCIDGGDGGSGGHGILIGSTPPGPGAPLVQLLGSMTQGGAPGSGGPSQCGSNGAPGQPGQPVHVNNGSSVTLTGAPRRMEGPSLARESQILTLTLRGSPGDVVRLEFQRGGFGPWPSAQAGARIAVLRTLSVGTLPGSGMLDVQVAIPDLGAGVQSRTVLMQPIFVDTNGDEHEGNSFALVLVDANV
jgi:hypothetical protein